MDVGFIGLGAMGAAMARNLVKAGHRVTVWNRSPQAAEALAREGVLTATSPSEAARGDAVISMLADDQAVRAVVLDSGMLESSPTSLVHVGCSTVSVALAKELAQRHADKGIAYVSAPVFGRPDVAAAGALQIVVAGPPKALATVQPLLDAMGQKTWPMGDRALQGQRGEDLR